MRFVFLFGSIGLLFFIVVTGDELAIEQPEKTQAAIPTAQKDAEPLNSIFNGMLGADKAKLFVSGNRVNIRSGPGVGNGILGQLNIGDEVMLLSTSGGWSEIETKLGRGWMSARYLAPEKPVPKPQVINQPRQRTIAVPSTKEIQAARNAIIQQSIASYAGSCPCPYNTDRAGRRCGQRSAWSRPGGYAPICYDSDVSQARLETFLARKLGAGN